MKLVTYSIYSYDLNSPQILVCMRIIIPFIFSSLLYKHFTCIFQISQLVLKANQLKQLTTEGKLSLPFDWQYFTHNNWFISKRFLELSRISLSYLNSQRLTHNCSILLVPNLFFEPRKPLFREATEISSLWERCYGENCPIESEYRCLVIRDINFPFYIPIPRRNVPEDLVLGLAIHHSLIPTAAGDLDLSSGKKARCSIIVPLNYSCTCRCISVSWWRCTSSREKSIVRSNWYLSVGRKPTPGPRDFFDFGMINGGQFIRDDLWCA